MIGKQRTDIELEIKMSSIKIAVALSLLLASPALAQPNRHLPAHSANPAVGTSDVVTVGGKYIGRDPDANVRAELRRDASEYLGQD